MMRYITLFSFVYIFTSVCLHFLFTLFYRALYTICGDAMRKAFLTQQNLLKHLNDAAEKSSRVVIPRKKLFCKII